MRKFHTFLAVTALLFTQPLFAADNNAMDPDEAVFQQCETISDACLKAGYVRAGDPGKMFWHDCMKPILLDKTVAGVTVDSKDVVACRQFKIKNLQAQVKQLQNHK